MGPTILTGRGGGLLAAAGLIAGVTLASRVVGFGRWLVFSREVGGTCVGQAYATANQLPNVLFEVAAGGALAAVVVPLVAGALADGRRDLADRAASALLTWALAMLLPLAVLLGVLARPIASAMTGSAGQSCAGATSTAASMLVVFAPQMLLYGVGIVLAGVLQAHRRFLAAALAPLLSSLVVIASYVAYHQLAERDWAQQWVLAGGTTAGVVALSLPLLWPVRRAGIRLRPTLHLPPGMAGRARALATAGVVQLVAQQLAVLVTIRLANDRGQTGAVNVYNYVQAVYLLPYAVAAVPLATSAFPRLADAAGEKVLGRVLPLVAAAGALGAAVLFATARPLQSFFVALDARPAAMSALGDAVRAYAPGLLGFSLIALLGRALFVRGHALQAGLATAAGWLVAAALPFTMLRGVSGDSGRTLVALGVASSAGLLLAAILLLLLVRRDWGTTVFTGRVRSLVTVVVAAIVAAAAGSLAARRTPSGLSGSVFGAVAVGLLVVIVFVMVAALLDRRLFASLRTVGAGKGSQ
ncbi:murein biosynthesis integral membrane protein MurJ [Calidifontibacter terrae]